MKTEQQISSNCEGFQSKQTLVQKATVEVHDVQHNPGILPLSRKYQWMLVCSLLQKDKFRACIVGSKTKDMVFKEMKI